MMKVLLKHLMLKERWIGIGESVRSKNIGIDLILIRVLERYFLLQSGLVDLLQDRGSHLESRLNGQKRQKTNIDMVVVKDSRIEKFKHIQTNFPTTMTKLDIQMRNV